LPKCVDQEQLEEKSLEECSTSSSTCTDPIVTSLKNEEEEKSKLTGSPEPVRPVHVTGQIGLTRQRPSKSKKCSRRQSRQATILARSTSSSDGDQMCLMAQSKKKRPREMNIKELKQSRL
jgi:hypothetical protein